MNYLDTMLPEYVATAFIFCLFAFKIYKKSFSTSVIIVAISLAICFSKYGDVDIAVAILLSSTFILMIRAILHRKDDTILRGYNV